ncbi:hypothetical protein KY338_06865 [Candidatus Woesearchaeota archaeon]|nr:hypothetical protein [Candidatus Woesearchaeota archaeon]MBW3006375.1 hypothetical protein [Candidatus Woesearchaeota archaeon]
MATEVKKEVNLSPTDTALVLESQQELKVLVKDIEGILDKIDADCNKAVAAGKKSVRETGKETKEIRLHAGYWIVSKNGKEQKNIIFEIVGAKEQGMLQKLAIAQSSVMASPDFSYSDKLQILMSYIGDESRILLDILNKIHEELFSNRPIGAVSAASEELREKCALIKTRIQQVEDSLK